MSLQLSFALIGFGEAGFAFADEAGWGSSARAFDIEPARQAAIQKTGIAIAPTCNDAIENADIVLSLVTASSALKAAQDCAPALKAGALWCDMNSVAPDTKRQASKAVSGAGGRYVDVAIMAPVEPKRLSVPLLVSGPDADEVAKTLQCIGFSDCTIAGNTIGQASAIKLCRSIMVKGLEALTDEMCETAEAAGVLDEVLASLDASETAMPWAERVVYARERMEHHGLRRADEMAEAKRMIEAYGVEPALTQGTIKRQRRRGGPGGKMA